MATTAPDLKITPLDGALNAVDNTLESRAHFIKILASSMVYIIADKPWDKRSPPDNDMHLMLVSDGQNQLQPMLAVFSNLERAMAFVPTAQHPFTHTLEVEMGWALLGVPLNAGIIVNPNSGRSFRVSPEMATELRTTAQIHVAFMQSTHRSQQPTTITAGRKPLLPLAVEEAQVEIQRLIALDKFPEAEQHVLTLEADGTQEEYLLCLRALIAREQSDHSSAIRLLHAALGKTRDKRLMANFWWVLGQISEEAGNPQEAMHAYFQAQAADPLELTHVMSLATILAKQRRLPEALALLREVKETHPSDPAPAALIAQLLLENDQYDDALMTLDELIAKYPNIAGLHYNRAACLQMVGRIEQATPEYELALRLDPNLDGHSQYVHTRKFSPAELTHDNLYIQMLEQRSRVDMPINSRIDANFALAKIYDLMGNFDLAFARMQTGNELKRSTFKHYSIDTAKSEIAKILALYNAKFIEQFKNTAAANLAPIFVLGMPRSGTTLTEQILAAHSHINAGSEMIYFGELADEFTRLWANYSVESDQHHDEIVRALKHIASGYTERTGKLQAPGMRFTDKMPGNYLNIGLIYLLFPGASIIHCQRQPLDICLSCYEHLFSKGLPYSYDLRELGEYYKTYLGAMSHWRSTIPKQFILDVQYEELVENPENQIRRILDFCGLEFENACMEFQNVKRSVKTASSVQVRQPLYKTSVNRWRKYRGHLMPLIEILGPDLVNDHV